MSASPPPTPPAPSSLGRRRVMIFAFALAIIGLLLPVPLYLFWYRPAEQAWEAKLPEYQKRFDESQAASSKWFLLFTKRWDATPKSPMELQELNRQIEEATEVSAQKHQRFMQYSDAFNRNEGASYKTASDITGLAAALGVGLVVLGLTCGIVSALRARVVLGPVLGMATGALIGGTVGNFWAGVLQGFDIGGLEYLVSPAFYAGIGLVVGLVCGLIARLRAKAAALESVR